MSKVEQRIEKLLALAGNNPNIHEAAAAFAQAQALADKAQIDLARLQIEAESRGERDSAPPEIKQRRVDSWRRASGWKVRLVDAVARANGCKCYYSKFGATIYGPEDRLDHAERLYNFIKVQVDRLTREFSAGSGRSRGAGKRAGTAFRLGCVAEIDNRLRAERERTLQAAREDAYQSGGEAALAATTAAIARVDRSADLARYAREKLNLRTGAGFSAGAGRASSAYAAGRAAGRTVNTSGRALK